MPEFSFHTQFFQVGAWVSDGNEMFASLFTDFLFCLIPKIIKISIYFSGSAGFAGNDIQSLFNRRTLKCFFYLLGIRRIENRQIQPYFSYTIYQSEDFGRQRRPTHAQQQSMRQPLIWTIIKYFFIFMQDFRFHPRSVQPITAFTNFCLAGRIFCPKRRINLK